MLDKTAIKQRGVALDELIKPVRAPTLIVHGYEMQPGARHRLVVLVLGTVPPRDQPDTCDHRLGSLLDRVPAQVPPRKLKVLAVPEAAVNLEDFVQGSGVFLARALTISTITQASNKRRAARTHQAAPTPAWMRQQAF